MTSKTVALALISLGIVTASAASQRVKKPTPFISFRQFPAEVYRGPLKIPRSVHQDSDGAWRDELNKWVAEPEVNFAGEYYLAGHSCGTCCRYYSLHNLHTGDALESISMFDAGDPPPETRDGHTYVPILFFRPDSRLLIVQYELDACTPKETGQCRQRYFIFANGRFRAISQALPFCTGERNAAE
jgi:hypothetical protein